MPKKLLGKQRRRIGLTKRVASKAGLTSKTSKAVPPAGTAKIIKWISTGALAFACGISAQTIRNAIERGNIRARQTGTGRYVIPRAEADRYVAENGYVSDVA